MDADGHDFIWNFKMGPRKPMLKILSRPDQRVTNLNTVMML